MLIRNVETLVDPGGPMPALTFVRIHTDEGVTGLGETFYTPRSVCAYIHEILAPQLIGLNAVNATALWSEMFQQIARRGVGGADTRALSAVDLALWDIKGKALGVPVDILLGGTTRPDGVPVYNTCAGATYAAAWQVGRGQSLPGDDLHRVRHDAPGLAVELRDLGFAGMKVWPFDDLAHSSGGNPVERSALRAAASVLESIRDAVGDDLQLMIEGHGLWSPSAAITVLREIEAYNVAWAEDMVLAHDARPLARMAHATRVPLAAGESLMGRWQFRQALEANALSYIQVDPSWCGGISEARNILALASAYGVSSAIHDCTGPINLLAGLHLASADPGVTFQEVLRAFLDEVYPRMVDTEWRLRAGRLSPPDRPGLGAELTDEYLSSPTLVRTQTIP